MKRILLSFFLLLIAVAANATDYSGSSFIIRDPVLSIQGGYTTSTNFTLFQSAGHVVSGRGTSTNFEVRSGFLWFPVVTTPVVTATAGSGQVALSWTAAVGSLGWTVSGYNVGRATTAGGAYTYTSLGNVLATTVTGLTGGTTYYFVIRAEDAFANSIVTSAEVSATPTTAAGEIGGVGAGGGAGLQTASVNFSGVAYPLARVTVLKDGAPAEVGVAAADGSFRIVTAGLSPGTYTFSIFAQDAEGRLSRPVTVTMEVSAGQIAAVAGILIPPTFDSDFQEVPAGAPIGFLGTAAPGALVTIFVDGETALQGFSGADGRFGFLFNTRGLARGAHTAYAVATHRGIRSAQSETLTFAVGDRAVPREPGVPVVLPPVAPPGRALCIRADFNCDGRVNLIDLSIMLFWWGKPLTPAAAERIDLIADGVINLFDFSVVVYYWTG